MGLIRTSVAGRVATLLIDRPDSRNALSIDMCNELVDALDEIDHSDARAVILSGAGRVFCAGADLSAVTGEKGLEFLPAFERMLEAVARSRLPTIAAIHGAALGGGLQLATVCDFRIATSEARLGIPSACLGIVINHENVQRLVLLVGVALAKEILMTGRTFTGIEGAAAGIVNRSVPADDLARAVGELANTLALNAPLSVQGVKRAIGVVVDQLAPSRSGASGEPADIDALVEAAYRSEDLQEGLRASREKRPPEFEGR